MITFHCVSNGEQYTLYSYPTVVCWEGIHIFYFMFSIILLILYFPLVLRMVNVDGDLNKVAIYWWKTWKFDKPDLRDMNLFSKKTVHIFFLLQTKLKLLQNFIKVQFERLYFILKLILVIISIFAREVSLANMIALFLVSLINMGTVFWIPPYYSKFVNKLVILHLYILEIYSTTNL